MTDNFKQYIDKHGSDFMYEDVDKNEIEELFGYIAKAEKQFGGEGEGDQYWTVYSFTNETETIYINFYGWYASYHGAEYEGWEQVKPQEVTITKYVTY